MINTEAWDKLKKQIEYHLKQDSNLTDIRINYQVKDTRKRYKKLFRIKCNNK